MKKLLIIAVLLWCVTGYCQPTATATVTATVTPTVTFTVTATPTIPTKTPTPTITKTPTNTVTKTPTVTYTPTPTRTANLHGVVIEATKGIVMPSTSIYGYADTGYVQIINLDWISNATGEVDFNLENVDASLMHVEIVPGAGDGSPTNLYDVTLNDPNGVDLLQSAGLNQSATNSAGLYSGKWPIPMYGTINLLVENAGEATGRVSLFIEKK